MGLLRFEIEYFKSGVIKLNQIGPSSDFQMGCYTGASTTQCSIFHMNVTANFQK